MAWKMEGEGGKRGRGGGGGDVFATVGRRGKVCSCLLWKRELRQVGWMKLTHLFLSLCLLTVTALAQELGPRRTLAHGVSVRLPKAAEVATVESPDGEKHLKAQLTDPARMVMVVKHVPRTGPLEAFAKEYGAKAIAKSQGKVVDIDPYEVKSGPKGKIIVTEHPQADGVSVSWEYAFAFESAADKAVVIAITCAKADGKPNQKFFEAIVQSLEMEK